MNSVGGTHFLLPNTARLPFSRTISVAQHMLFAETCLMWRGSFRRTYLWTWRRTTFPFAFWMLASTSVTARKSPLFMIRCRPERILALPSITSDAIRSGLHFVTSRCVEFRSMWYHGDGICGLHRVLQTRRPLKMATWRRIRLIRSGRYHIMET